MSVRRWIKAAGVLGAITLAAAGLSVIVQHEVLSGIIPLAESPAGQEAAE